MCTVLIFNLTITHNIEMFIIFKHGDESCILHIICFIQAPPNIHHTSDYLEKYGNDIKSYKMPSRNTRYGHVTLCWTAVQATHSKQMTIFHCLAISWLLPCLQRPLRNELQATERYINRSIWYFYSVVYVVKQESNHDIARCPSVKYTEICLQCTDKVHGQVAQINYTSSLFCLTVT